MLGYVYNSDEDSIDMSAANRLTKQLEGEREKGRN